MRRLLCQVNKTNWLKILIHYPYLQVSSIRQHYPQVTLHTKMRDSEWLSLITIVHIIYRARLECVILSIRCNAQLKSCRSMVISKLLSFFVCNINHYSVNQQSQ